MIRARQTSELIKLFARCASTRQHRLRQTVTHVHQLQHLKASTDVRFLNVFASLFAWSANIIFFVERRGTERRHIAQSQPNPHHGLTLKHMHSLIPSHMQGFYLDNVHLVRNGITHSYPVHMPSSIQVPCQSQMTTTMRCDSAFGFVEDTLI